MPLQRASFYTQETNRSTHPYILLFLYWIQQTHYRVARTCKSVHRESIARKCRIISASIAPSDEYMRVQKNNAGKKFDKKRKTIYLENRTRERERVHGSSRSINSREIPY